LVAVVISFFLAVPIVIYYAIGYSFDFEQWKLIKTGILLIYTNPNGVQIFIDGNQKNASPARIRFLLPKTYNLELKKDGYISWKKSVTVSAQQITHLNAKDSEIYLFLQEPETTLIATSTQPLILMDPTSRQPVATSSFDFLEKNPSVFENSFVMVDSSLYRIIEGEINLIEQGIDNAYWENDNGLLLYANRNNIWLLDPSTGEKGDLIERSQQVIVHPQYNSKTNQIFYLQEGNILTIEAGALFDKNITKIIDVESNITEFFIDKKGERVTYILENGFQYEAKIR